MKWVACRWGVFAAAALPWPVGAHSFGQVYSLPVPFWLYAWASVIALLASFVVACIFALKPQQDLLPTAASRNILWFDRLRRWHVLRGLRVLSVGLLLLCMACGFWGTPSAYENFSMTFFWIVFLLGAVYAAMLLGNFYAVLNPWLIVARAWPYPALWRYPRRWGYMPAVALFMGLIWVELFARNTPLLLSQLLLGYSVFTAVGVVVFGRRAWFKYVDIFSVLFSLVSAMAWFDWQTKDGRVTAIHRRTSAAQFAGPVVQRFSLLLFLLALLAATAFDGLHSTAVWHRLYWVDLYQCCFQSAVGSNPFQAFPLLRSWHVWWQSAWLLLLPLLYLGVYLLFVVFSRRMAGSQLSVKALALAYAPSLLPIALVYHISHYYTLLQTQGIKIIALASDPMGWGWNVFGTADWYQRTIIPDLSTVWHVQVGLIVLGHIAGVAMAHRTALQLFVSPRRALLSQLPMLMLMMLFTVAGLWILSLPMKAGA